MEEDIEYIKNKLKSDDFDINNLEKKITKLEKKIIQHENKITKLDKLNNSPNDTESEDSNSDVKIDVDKILREIENLEKEINNFSQSESIETLIDKYIEFHSKLNLIKIKNNDFKLSIEYL